MRVTATTVARVMVFFIWFVGVVVWFFWGKLTTEDTENTEVKRQERLDLKRGAAE